MVTIGEVAFCGCLELSNIVLSNQLQTIGVCAFSGCEKLARISIPSTITTIGSSAFDSGYTRKPGGGEINHKCTTEITIDKPKDSVLGAPWSVYSPGKVIWQDGETLGR